MKIKSQLVVVIFGMVGVYSSSLAAPRYESKVVIPNQVNPDSYLLKLVSDLQRISDKRNLSAVAKLVSDDFFFSRDFGGLYNSDLSGAENFINALSLDDTSLASEYRGTGWKHFAELLKEGSFQRVNKSVCTPANAVPVNVERPDEFWLSWGYVNGTDVFVRRAPNLSAEPLTSLSYEVVEPVSGKEGDRVKGFSGNDLWIEVNTAAGISGYMYSSFFRNFQKAQICFKRENQSWRISGFIGAGE